MTINREMPRYVCHKQVWALKIASLKEGVEDKNSVLMSFSDEGYAPIHVDFDWYYRHKPEAGGYYVVYRDGYKSYSPAKAFEDGYTLQSGAPAAQAAPVVPEDIARDAERYRWLRERNWNESALFVVQGHHSLVRLGTDCPSGERLDAAIDAAIAKGE